MNNLTVGVLCALLVLSYSNESNSTLLISKAFFRARQPTFAYIANLSLRDEIFCTGAFISFTLVITAAHCLHELPSGCNFREIHIKPSITFVPDLKIYFILEIVFSSYDFSIKDKGVDFAVLRLTENIFPYCVLGGVYVDLSKNYVPAEMKVSLKLCEIQNNNLNEISAGVGSFNVIALSNEECIQMLERDIDDSLLCGAVQNFGDRILTKMDTGAPLIRGRQLVGILSNYRPPNESSVLIFTRVSIYEEFVHHEAQEVSDYDDNESTWSSGNSNGSLSDK